MTRGLAGNRPGQLAEHGRLGPQQAHIGQTVPVQCHRERRVQRDLARIVHLLGLASRLKRRRYGRIQTGLAGHLDQQHRPGLRNRSATAALDADRRAGCRRSVAARIR